MAANKKFRCAFQEFLVRRFRIFAWFASDMRHQHFNILTFESKKFGEFHADICSINISVNSARWFEGTQFVNQFNIAYIACMPDFINIFKILEDFWVEIAMCIGK